jgi:hypothetical protein
MAISETDNEISYLGQIIKLLQTKHSLRKGRAWEVAIKNSQLIYHAFRTGVRVENVAEDLDERSRHSL